MSEFGLGVGVSHAARYETYPLRSSAFGMTYTGPVPTLLRMSEQSDRLKQAIRETKLSMRQISERWGWSYDTLKSNANGNMPFSFNKAQVYAARLKVRAEWLYAGTPPMREPPAASKRALVEAPVIGWVQAGQLADVGQLREMSDAEIETVTLSGLPAGEWFATDVRGDSMDRVSPEGSRIIVNASDRIPIPGRYYLFSLRGEATYKLYYDNPVKRLEPYSTNPANRTIYLGEDPDWIVIGRVCRSMLDLG